MSGFRGAPDLIKILEVRMQAPEMDALRTRRRSQAAKGLRLEFKYGCISACSAVCQTRMYVSIYDGSCEIHAPGNH